METCPCGTGKPYDSCCELVHTQLSAAQTAEALMRARYCAFAKGLIDFLYDTYHAQVRRYQQKTAIAQWAAENKWMQLEIIQATAATVEFKAHYLCPSGDVEIHHEKSTFKKQGDCWYYYDGRLLS